MIILYLFYGNSTMLFWSKNYELMLKQLYYRNGVEQNLISIKISNKLEWFKLL